MTAEGAVQSFNAGPAADAVKRAAVPYDSRLSSNLRPSPFNSFFTALDATTSPLVAVDRMGHVEVSFVANFEPSALSIDGSGDFIQ